MQRRTFLKVITDGLIVGAVVTASGGLYAQSAFAKSSHLMASAPAPTSMVKSHYFTYVGTYTGPNSKGIYGFRFDTATGQFSPLGLVAEVENPSWVVSDPQHRFLYAVSEMVSGSKGNGAISSYAINAETGALTFLNKVDSLGGSPCHLVVDKTGKMLFVANYGTGSVASFAIKPDGSIGEKTVFDQLSGSSINVRRQKGPHAHAVVLSSDNRFLFVPNLGTDHIKIYKVDAANGTFTANDPAIARVRAGMGPRHFAFGPGEKFAYANCEMGSSVAVFSYNRTTGALTPVQTISNLPGDFIDEDNSGEIGIGRSGRFLYVTNRGHDSVTVYAIDQRNGTLSTVQNISAGGKIPRNFAIDPSGKYLIVANQKSDNLVVFNINQTTGKLTPTSQVISVPAPVSILFTPGA